MDGTNVKPKVVNFFGGPKSGKSASAMGLFVEIRFYFTRAVNYVDTKFGLGNMSLQKDEINILEHHFPDVDRLRALMEFNDCINIFLLRTENNSDVSEEGIKVDSRLLNMLNELKIKIYVKAYSTHIPIDVCDILESEEWF